MALQSEADKNKAISKLIEDATKGLDKRHPAEVTADRLGDASEQWHDLFDGAELDAIGQIIQALNEIAEGER